MTISEVSNIIQKGREFITSEFGYEEVRLDQYAVLKGFVLIHFIFYGRVKSGVYDCVLLYNPVGSKAEKLEFVVLSKSRADANSEED